MSIPLKKEKMSLQEKCSVTSGNFELPEVQSEVFRAALMALNTHRVPYVIEGAFAIYYYCGMWRNTKDLDIFVEEKNVGQALAALNQFGFETSIEEPRWLSKAVRNECFVDIIHGSGNRLAKIDSLWISRGRKARILGLPALIASPEDTISFKAFIQERHRYDGADILHIIEGLGGKLEWEYLIERFGDHWPLLLAIVTNFFYVYPSHRDYVPRWVYEALINKLQTSLYDNQPLLPVCQGTLISTFSYVADLERGYQDAREVYGSDFGASRMKRETNAPPEVVLLSLSAHQCFLIK